MSDNVKECKCPVTCNCRTETPKKCPFVAAHPNWMKCPFMSSMIGCKTIQQQQGNAQACHDKCDEAHCVDVPGTTCSSCHNSGFCHTVTLDTETDHAADQTSDLLS